MIVRDKQRVDTVREISKLLDGTCAGCTLNTNQNKREGNGRYAQLSGYCNKECSVGQELQALGRRLCK